ncbi:MAG: hypothetical protein OXC93_12245, partial [Rhodospirillaceae bacterium]|nr:hypothetical protein [Rhodospirillaceae bacterium]
RLGLRAHGSDLNPVAVLVSKATCEIPPKFADLPPVNPERDPHVAWKGAQGLAKDIGHYGKWMRDEAEARIGHLYPKVSVTEAMASARPDLKPCVGRKLTVIAWLWARTVRSPNPAFADVEVPLASSFVLSSKKGKEAWVEPVIEGRSYRFVVRVGTPPPQAKTGTKSGGSGSQFLCLMSGSPMPFDYLRSEAKAGRMGASLLAIVGEGVKGRAYLSSTSAQERAAREVRPAWTPDTDLPARALSFRVQEYGMRRWRDLFTDRQLVALTTFSDLVSEARDKVLADALAAGMDAAAPRLSEGGTGAQAYAEAVATYLGLSVSRQANRCSSLTFWDPGGAKVQQVFARQALPMVWDFCEANPFSDSSGNFVGQVGYLANAVANSPIAAAQGAVIQQDAASNTPLVTEAVLATDPPYYDNIGYADLSDFFYVWQRRALRDVWPDLFRRVLVPKEEELVATPYRHGGKDEAEQFFMEGMGKALRNMHRSGADDYPVTIYYAFKQSEVAKEGLTSAGWATFLQGIVDAGYVIDGTWPVRTELAGNLKKRFNALASSIVLVCRRRPVDAPIVTRREFMAQLRSEIPDALVRIRAGGVGPVDMAQASIGPGMGIFTAASQVLEPDDTPMTVRTAIALINQVRDEISGEQATGHDPDSRFCIDWFETFDMAEGKSGDAITMAQAYGIGIGDLETAQVFSAQGGTARLLRRDELPVDWDPKTDKRLTDWECAQHLARVLELPSGGIEAASRLYARMLPERSGAARDLTYRLYEICERKGRTAEAQIWNMLAKEWPAIEAAAADIEPQEAEEPLLL